MKESGLLIKLMDLEFILILMVLSILEFGVKTSSMERGKRVGLMELVMKEIMFLERNRDTGISNGQMDLSTLDSSSIIISKALENIDGLMAEAIMENGETIRCMVKAFSPGLMAEDMKESTLKIKNRDSVYSFGQMVANILANGVMESSMAEAHL